jgi:hypothetical protein
MKKALVLLLLLATPAFAQTTQVRRGVPLYFDHDEQSLVVTTRYQLCEDVIDDTSCKDIEGVVRLQGSLTFQFALPTWVKNGAHIYAVRAFGEGEYSDPSNALTLLVTGKPLPPTNHRSMGPNPAPPSQPTTGSAPPPATLSVAPVGGLSTKPPTPSMKNPRNQ